MLIKATTRPVLTVLDTLNVSPRGARWESSAGGGPEGWPWSSARAHLDGRNDGLVTVAALRDAVGEWRAFLAGDLRERDAEELRRHEHAGRSAMSASWPTWS